MKAERRARLFLAQCAVLELYPDAVFGDREGDTLRFWIRQEERGRSDAEGEIRLADKALALPIEEAQRLWRLKQHHYRLQEVERAKVIDDED